MKLNLESFRRPLLQLALDFTDLDQACKVAAAAYPHFDLLEIGTPLIIEEGLGALQKLKARFPDKLFLADLKIMDAGHLEARSGFSGEPMWSPCSAPPTIPRFGARSTPP